MQHDSTSRELQLRAAFEKLRITVEALRTRWRDRVEATRLAEHLAAIEAGLAAPEASASSPGYQAVAELGRFLDQVRRRCVPGPTLPALRAARALFEIWGDWIEGGGGGGLYVLTGGGGHDDLDRIDPSDLPELMAAMTYENARGGIATEADCAVCAMLARQRARRGN